MTISCLLAVAGLPRVGEGRHYIMGEPFAENLRLLCSHYASVAEVCRASA